MISWEVTKTSSSKNGTNPRRVVPGREEFLGGARPKKYLRGPDLVMRKEMKVVRRVTLMTVITRLLLM